jgi:hypothetical protein
MGPNFPATLMGVMHLYDEIQLNVAFASVSQCYHGAEQAQMPIYSRTGLKGSRLGHNQCVNFEQPFGLISLQ